MPLGKHITGTPSFFLHPADAFHGDLGMVEKDDVVLLISNSGETDEILKLIPFFKQQENIIISINYINLTIKFIISFLSKIAYFKILILIYKIVFFFKNIHVNPCIEIINKLN